MNIFHDSFLILINGENNKSGNFSVNVKKNCGEKNTLSQTYMLHVSFFYLEIMASSFREIIFLVKNISNLVSSVFFCICVRIMLLLLCILAHTVKICHFLWTKFYLEMLSLFTKTFIAQKLYKNSCFINFHSCQCHCCYIEGI